MSKFTTLIKNFIDDESGLTAVEYAIAGGLVVGAMVSAFITLGTNATTQISSLGCAAAGGTEAVATADQVTNDGAAVGSTVCNE